MLTWQHKLDCDCVIESQIPIKYGTLIKNNPIYLQILKKTVRTRLDPQTTSLANWIKYTYVDQMKGNYKTFTLMTPIMYIGTPCILDSSILLPVSFGSVVMIQNDILQILCENISISKKPMGFHSWQMTPFLEGVLKPHISN